jgi:hypothetical protein
MNVGKSTVNFGLVRFKVILNAQSDTNVVTTKKHFDHRNKLVPSKMNVQECTVLPNAGLVCYGIFPYLQMEKIMEHF